MSFDSRKSAFVGIDFVLGVALVLNCVSRTGVAENVLSIISIVIFALLLLWGTFLIGSQFGIERTRGYWSEENQKMPNPEYSKWTEWLCYIAILFFVPDVIFDWLPISTYIFLALDVVGTILATSALVLCLKAELDFQKGGN